MIGYHPLHVFPRQLPPLPPHVDPRAAGHWYSAYLMQSATMLGLWASICQLGQRIAEHDPDDAREVQSILVAQARQARGLYNSAAMFTGDPAVDDPLENVTSLEARQGLLVQYWKSLRAARVYNRIYH